MWKKNSNQLNNNDDASKISPENTQNNFFPCIQLRDKEN